MIRATCSGCRGSSTRTRRARNSSQRRTARFGRNRRNGRRGLRRVRAVRLADSPDPVSWATVGLTAPSITRRTRRLDRGWYEVIEAVWRKALREVRVAAEQAQPEGVYSVGDTYVFGYFRGGKPPITSKTSAPPPKSAPDRLVHLSRTLRESLLADETLLPDVAGRILTDAERFRSAP